MNNQPWQKDENTERQKSNTLCVTQDPGGFQTNSNELIGTKMMNYQRLTRAERGMDRKVEI